MAHTDDKNGVRAAELPKVKFEGVECLFPGPLPTAVESQWLLDRMINEGLPKDKSAAAILGAKLENARQRLRKHLKALHDAVGKLAPDVVT
jgi:hypothetical protein